MDFGKDLQEFFLRHGHLKMVIDNRAKRSFAQADVNTVIVLAGPPERERALSEEEMRARKVRFVAFHVPFEEALSPILFSEIEDDRFYTPLAGFRVLNRREFRAVLLDQWALWEGSLEEGDDESLLEARGYAGDKWGGQVPARPGHLLQPFWRRGRASWCAWGISPRCAVGLRRAPTSSSTWSPWG